MSVLSSPEIITAAENTAIQKISFSTRKTLTLAILAGIYIAMGGLLSLVIGYGFPEITTNNPGLQRLLSGAMFPLGLIPVLRNWLLVYIGNFIGAIFFVYVMVYLADIVKSDPWNTAIQNIAEAKVGMSWGVTFIKGIGANWFVCLAVWLGIACRSAAGKFIGLWFPVMCFVALGYEHSIANMFFIPLGMLQGADVEIYDFVVRNLIPATLGNITGGAFFVGGLYWLAYHKS